MTSAINSATVATTRRRASGRVANACGVSVATPEDNMMLIMPTRRLDKGLTAVRLGRLVDGTQDPNPAPPLTA